MMSNFIHSTVVGLLLVSYVSGCSNAGEGAVSGAAIGALSGLAIGSLSGDAGKGAAIGAVVGGVGGAVIGDQNRRRDEAAAAQAAAPRTVTVAPAYGTGQALGRLVGDWRVAGTITPPGQPPVNVTGTARGVVDKQYFVRLEVRLTDPRTNQTVEGTSVISQTGGNGLELANSFSTSPEMQRFRGEMDASGAVFSFSQVSPSGRDRRVTFRTSAGRAWTAEGWAGDVRTESLTFTPQ